MLVLEKNLNLADFLDKVDFHEKEVSIIQFFFIQLLYVFIQFFDKTMNFTRF